MAEPERFEVGQELVAAGPNPSAKPANYGKGASGWWEPSRCTVLEVVDDGYIVKGKGMTSNRILFGCETNWRVVEEKWGDV